MEAVLPSVKLILPLWPVRLWGKAVRHSLSKQDRVGQRVVAWFLAHRMVAGIGKKINASIRNVIGS